MRFSRLRKFKSKNSRFILISKLMLIWYLLLLSAAYFTSDTTAHFNDRLKTNGGVAIGTWETKDPVKELWKLAFTDNGNQNWESCEQMTINTKIKNVGNGDMETESTYEVYYIENGNPQKLGEKMKLEEGKGIIKALKSGESTKLTFKAELPGRYVFKAYQYSEQSGQSEVWSKEIIVDCDSVQNSEKQEIDNISSEEGKTEQEKKVKEETVNETENTENSTKKDIPKNEEIVEETKEKEIEEEKVEEKKPAEPKREEIQTDKQAETKLEETEETEISNSNEEGEGK